METYLFCCIAIIHVRTQEEYRPDNSSITVINSLSLLYYLLYLLVCHIIVNIIIPPHA